MASKLLNWGYLSWAPGSWSSPKHTAVLYLASIIGSGRNPDSFFGSDRCRSPSSDRGWLDEIDSVGEKFLIGSKYVFAEVGLLDGRGGRFDGTKLDFIVFVYNISLAYANEHPPTHFKKCDFDFCNIVLFSCSQIQTVNSKAPDLPFLFSESQLIFKWLLVIFRQRKEWFN